MSILNWYNKFRKKTFPPSVNDIEWRHERVESSINKVLEEIDIINSRINALSDFIILDEPKKRGDSRSEGWFVNNLFDQKLKLPFYEFYSKSEFDVFFADMNMLSEQITAEEKKLLKKYNDAKSFSYEGFCICCSGPRSFHVDYECLGNYERRQPYYRERLVCPECRLNNRMRACFHLLTKNFPLDQEALIYATEQTTDLFSHLQRIFPLIVGSEFLSDGTAKGGYNINGVRNEDATNLSFSDQVFNFVLSFECLEHIPNYRAALAEFCRVLKPNGSLLMSAPFNINVDQNLTRALIENDGVIRHLVEPEYHGDPINGQGILCFYHFGWDLLEEIKNCGFSSASVIVYCSRTFGYLGGLQTVILAKK
jgi:hypothetical protein